MNNENKQTFLFILGQKLVDSGIKVKHSDGDADSDIIFSALTQASKSSITVVGEDTDLLILLLWHYDPSRHYPVYIYSNTDNNDNRATNDAN